MDLNALLPSLDRLEEAGAVILLKWDGGRKENRKTIVISKPGTDYLCRLDTDDLEVAIRKAVADYDETFGKNI
jgi:hypothetical protein